MFIATGVVFSQQSKLTIPESLGGLRSGSNLQGYKQLGMGGVKGNGFRIISFNSGQHSIPVNYSVKMGALSYSANGSVDNYEFLPDRSYRLSGYVNQFKRGNNVKFRIIDATDESIFNFKQSKKSNTGDIVFSIDGSKFAYVDGGSIVIGNMTDGSKLFLFCIEPLVTLFRNAILINADTGEELRAYTSITTEESNIYRIRWNPLGTHFAFVTSGSKSGIGYQIWGNN